MNKMALRPIEAERYTKRIESDIKVFISSPYASLSVEAARAEARFVAKKVASMGYVPVSPVLCFDGVYEEATQREEALKASLELLESCDYICFSKHFFADSSKGMDMERLHALKEGVPELEI